MKRNTNYYRSIIDKVIKNRTYIYIYTNFHLDISKNNKFKRNLYFYRLDKR